MRQQQIENEPGVAGGWRTLKAISPLGWPTLSILCSERVGPSSLLACCCVGVSFIPKNPSAGGPRLDSNDTNCSTANLRDAAPTSPARDFHACSEVSPSSLPVSRR